MEPTVVPGQAHVRPAVQEPDERLVGALEVLTPPGVVHPVVGEVPQTQTQVLQPLVREGAWEGIRHGMTKYKGIPPRPVNVSAPRSC